MQAPSVADGGYDLPGYAKAPDDVVPSDLVGDGAKEWSLEAKGYIHQVTVLRRSQQSPAELLPRVHRVISLLKRWLLGTHQGAVSLAHLDYYLDEFTFRFNRRKSRSRGKLFYRLLQQAMAVEPAPYKTLVGGTLAKPRNPNI